MDDLSTSCKGWLVLTVRDFIPAFGRTRRFCLVSRASPSEILERQENSHGCEAMNALVF
jgi:hypothetical protein